MNHCLNLTRSGEYAIAALSRLALNLENSSFTSVPTKALAQEQKIPPSFLVKILAQCSKAGIIRSKKGVSGGNSLAKSPKKISLLEIIEACEGSYAREQCVFYTQRACSGPGCKVFCPLRQEEEILRQRLQKTTLADMTAALKIHPEEKNRLPH